MNIQTIPITKARNEFFDLIDKSYRDNMTFVIEKSGIPVVRWIPYKEEADEKNEMEKRKKEREEWIAQVKKLHRGMKKTTDSVLILRKFRQGIYD